MGWKRVREEVKGGLVFGVGKVLFRAIPPASRDATGPDSRGGKCSGKYLSFQQTSTAAYLLISTTSVVACGHFPSGKKRENAKKTPLLAYRGCQT